MPLLNVLVTRIDGEKLDKPMYAGFVSGELEGWFAYAHKAPPAIRRQGPFDSEYGARLRVINSGTWWTEHIPTDQIDLPTSVSREG